MPNGVPAPECPSVRLARQVATRSLAARLDGFTDEVNRLIDAALLVMRDSGNLDPQVREIVRTAGLSNQSFYRHFESKDALLLAVIERGQMELLATIEERMMAAATPQDRVRAWVETVLVQARRHDAARSTRPFIINGARLADLFPDMSMRTMKALAAPLGAAIAEMVGTPMDTRLGYDLTV